ncbi:MAG: YgiQ family radical SAM protein [Clostridiales bacterium]|nr:YgiQ family radical SAM protein [Clostridiales bacterium]
MSFLPFLPNELTTSADFIFIIPEAYVDHPSFGHAIISRVVESEGFSIAIISQPKTDQDYKKFGRPNIAFLISGGVVDSMVNNYTVAKFPRKRDEYSEGGRVGNRPDRAVTVYSRVLKRLYPDVPIIIGGIEASLRRMAHYDYWDNVVKPSILVDSRADLLMYGMGERALWNVLDAIKRGIPVKKIKDVDGTAFLQSYHNLPKEVKEKIDNNDIMFCPSFEEVCADRLKYVQAFKLQAENSNYLSGKMLAQKHRNEYVIVNPPSRPLTTEEMDKVYALPYMLRAHDSYQEEIPAISEVRFSITSHRGCFGNCSYCALSFHQGRTISKRSLKSIVSEAEKLIKLPDFKGYIHDIVGPTANFRNPSCKKQVAHGVCKDRQCIGYKVCPSLIVDHQDYLDVLRAVRSLPGIKKVFVRSGIRYDYMLMDKNNQFFEELVEHHISGQLKVAPEHCCDNVLRLMNKPKFSVYEEFKKKYEDYNLKLNKKQFLVPYLISSHPGCTIEDALKLTDYLKKVGRMPEQVQDFYPTPATKSTCMFYTGIDPDTGQEIFVPRTAQEKVTQRALLQYKNPKNKKIIAPYVKKGLKHK